MTILLSFNEIQSSARKAASGAGLPHGVAEEVGHAAVWLSARGLDAVSITVTALSGGTGCAALLRGLAAIDSLCAGEADRIVLEDGAARPLLIGLAGAAQASRGVPIAVEQGDRGGVLALSGLRHAGELVGMAGPLRLCRDDGGMGRQPGTQRPAPTDSAAYDAALALAAKTYVPASELSRTLGAGAGTTDND